MQDKYLLVWQDKHNEPTKEGPFHMYSVSPYLPRFLVFLSLTPKPVLATIDKPFSCHTQ